VSAECPRSPRLLVVKHGRHVYHKNIVNIIPPLAPPLHSSCPRIPVPLLVSLTFCADPLTRTCEPTIATLGNCLLVSKIRLEIDVNNRNPIDFREIPIRLSTTLARSPYDSNRNSVYSHNISTNHTTIMAQSPVSNGLGTFSSFHPCKRTKGRHANPPF
jgi:hypothetical protein